MPHSVMRPPPPPPQPQSGAPPWQKPPTAVEMRAALLALAQSAEQLEQAAQDEAQVGSYKHVAAEYEKAYARALDLGRNLLGAKRKRFQLQVHAWRQMPEHTRHAAAELARRLASDPP